MGLILFIGALFFPPLWLAWGAYIFFTPKEEKEEINAEVNNAFKGLADGVANFRAETHEMVRETVAKSLGKDTVTDEEIEEYKKKLRSSYDKYR